MPRFTLALFLGLGLCTVGCGGDEGTSAGNSTACGSGEDCTNDCNASETSCELTCAGGSTCDATCREGQDCSFTCAGDAECTFNCSAGMCTVSGDSNSCACSGNCFGTCGDNSGAGGTSGGGDCECGGPTDPGYQACIIACNS